MAEAKTIALVFAEAGDTKRTLKWPCKVSVPQDGGSATTQELVAEFTIPTPVELQGFATSQTLFGRRPDIELLEKHLKAFPGLPGADDVPFEHQKEVLLARPYVVDGLVTGLIEMARGRAAKN